MIDSDSPRWHGAAACCPEDNAPDIPPTSSRDHPAGSFHPYHPADSPSDIAPIPHIHAPPQTAASPPADSGCPMDLLGNPSAPACATDQWHTFARPSLACNI